MSKNITSTVIYKAFIILILILNSIGIKAQNNCEITLPEGVTLPVCYGEEITLSVLHDSNCAYQWFKNGNPVSNENSYFMNIEVTSNATYSIKVTNTQTQAVCEDDIQITVMNEFEIEFEQTQLTCSNSKAENGQNAKVIATASGEGFVSFTYEWGCDSNDEIWTNPGNPQEAIGLKAWKEYCVTVTGITQEGNECVKEGFFTPKAYPNPKLVIVSTPKDTAYLQNPHVKFSFEGDISAIEHNSWSWAFFNNPENAGEISSESILQEPTNTYYAESKEGSPYQVQLNVKSADYGCDTTFSTSIVVLPVDLKIPNVFTPNGDGINDYFIIDNAPGENNDNENDTRGYEYESYNPLKDYYLSTELTIFNRWGRIVYHSSDYNNDWDGGKLPDGTYFYVLECKGEYQNHRYQGSVAIFGSGR